MLETLRGSGEIYFVGESEAWASCLSCGAGVRPGWSLLRSLQLGPEQDPKGREARPSGRLGTRMEMALDTS